MNDDDDDDSHCNNDLSYVWLVRIIVKIAILFNSAWSKRYCYLNIYVGKKLSNRQEREIILGRLIRAVWYQQVRVDRELGDISLEIVYECVYMYLVVFYTL